MSDNKNIYIVDNKQNSLSNTTLNSIKENTVYILKALINISDRDGKTDNLSSGYLQQIMSEKLLNTVDKAQDDETAKLLKGLVLALDNPENREKFLKSYFYASLILLRNGARDASSVETWINYLPLRPNQKYKSALLNALYSYKDDPDAEIGLDMNKFLKTIVEQNEDGEYVLTNLTAHDGDQLLKAMEENIAIMKNSKKFREQFTNPAKKSSIDSENE